MKSTITSLAAVSLFLGMVAADAALVSHFTFDETGVTTIADSGPAGASGTIGSNVGTGTPGILGTAFTFRNDSSQNGIVDMGSAATFTAVTSSQALTLSVWLNWTTPGTRDSAVFLGNDTGANRYLDVGTTSSGAVYGRVRDSASASTPFPELVRGTGLNDGQWHHVAYTADAATGVTQLYIDGTLAGATSTPAFTLPAFNNLEIGRLGRSSPTDAYAGAVDELRIYDSVLTAAEIAALAVPEAGIPALLGLAAAGSFLRRRR